MTSKAKLMGVPLWQANLTKEIAKIKGASEAGLLTAALYLKGESQKEVPVAIGNLRNSAYVTSSNGRTHDNPKFKGSDAGKMHASHIKETVGTLAEAKAKKLTRGPSAYVGYSAVYALSVHENPRSGKTGGVSPSGKKYSSGLTESGNKSTRITWARVGKWKFLEDPLKNNTKKFLEIIRMRARIK